MYKPTDQNTTGPGFKGSFDGEYNASLDEDRYGQKDEISDNFHANRPSAFYESTEMTMNSRRPNVSYAELITMAIESSPEQMLTLKEIYHWISSNYPYFEMKKVGWQNSIRHNLSLNRCFFKVPRQEGTRGKGSFWKINYEFQNVKVNYRTRKYTYVTPNHSIHSLTQILNDNNLLGDSIGVNELSHHKTTIFNGNLRNDEEYFESHPHLEGQDASEDNKIDRIFSFK